jgi:hypothetical protein
MTATFLYIDNRVLDTAKRIPLAMTQTEAVERIKRTLGSQDQLDESDLSAYVRLGDGFLVLVIFGEATEAALAEENRASVLAEEVTS